MKLITLLIGALAAGTLAKHMHDRRQQDAEQSAEHARHGRSTVYDLSDDEAVLREEAVPETAEGVALRYVQISSIQRDMNPLTLQGQSIVTFTGGDAPDVVFTIPSASGQYLRTGEWGMLEVQGDQFLSFTKDSGEIVGAMYHVPSPQEVDS